MTPQTNNIPTLTELIKRFCIKHPNITFGIVSVTISLIIALAATAIREGIAP